VKNYIIEQLRKNASVRGKQRTWVSELSDDQMHELYHRLRNGESAKSIAARIQRIWGVNPDSTIHSISQGILKFKKRIAHLILTIPSSATPTSEEDFEQMNRLDSLEGMERVAQLQRERIERMMLEEKELGIKHQNLSRDLQSIAMLSKVIMKQKEFEIKYENADPVNRRRLERTQKSIQKRFDKFMDNYLPTEDHKNKFLQTTETFLELIEERAIPVKIGPNGNPSL